MAWRKKRAKPTPAASVTGPNATANTPGIPHEPVADEVVLVELSRAFADTETNRLPDDAREQSETSDTTPAEPVPGDATSVEPSTSDAGSTDRDHQGSGSSDPLLRGEGAVDRAPADSSPTTTGSAPTPTESDELASSKPPIIIGAEDHFPDTVYLDEELQREGAGGGPVVIDDDGSSDAVLPRDATSRGIEPRIRQRRIGVKRAQSRRRLWWIALGASVLVVVIGLLALLGSSLFAVDEITVTGNVYADPEELSAIVDDIIGTPVLRLDTSEIEAQLEALPWVESARVRADFPDAASIELRERVPVAAMAGADGLSRVIDDDGRVLAIVEGIPVALVWIAGPGTLDVAAGEIAPIGYVSAASLVTKFTPTIRERVETMLVTPDGADLVLLLSGGNPNIGEGQIEVRFGSAIGDNAQIEKLVRLERALQDTDDELVSVIDVSTSQVTVR